MFLPSMLAGAASFKTLWVAMRSALREWAASRRRRAQDDHERLLNDSKDRFELERRERTWNRWHDSDGSLLGH
jgi:hypothetical protein